MAPDQALALGRLRAGLPDAVPVATRRAFAGGEAAEGAIARTRDHIDYDRGEAAFALLDFDRKGMPEAVAGALAARGGFWPALVAAAPCLARAARVRRASTSAGLIDTRTGAAVGGGAGGEHVYLLARDGADVERFLRDLHERCWLQGLGWFLVGAAGQLLERSVVDRTVGAPERLVFEGAPVLEPPLGQDLTARAPEWADGEALDARAACPPLTRVERAEVAELKEAARAALAQEAARVRAAADRALAERLAERHGVTPATALRMAGARHRGVLLPHVELAFDDPAIGAATVAEVLREPERFVGETLADPLEGVAYGRGKAKVMRRDDGSLWIHSFAHGRTVYELKLDALALEAALRATEPPTAAVDAYLRLLRDAELEPDEEARLSELVRQLSGVGARPLAARVRAARQQRAAEDAEERRRAAAEARAGEGACSDGRRRVRLPAPLSDDERTPVLEALDEVLGAAPDPEPPMRNADGTAAEIRARRPWGLHGLTGAGADAEEAPEDRVPPPEEPLITALDPVGLGLLVERHVEHVRVGDDGRERAVALPEPFLRAYLGWRGSRLPVVRAVVTAPLVTREGGLLAGAGLDRAREVVFRIEPQLLALVPADPDAIDDAEVVEALRFLVDEWLCDVAAGFAGRVVLLAYALTIVERVLLPERPAFFVTAGQRGGGKTTVVTMVVAAVLGRRPPAAAWSPAAEERRKALLAYLGEGVATLVWDNIERGTAISCPSIEKALTAAEFTDRVLGVSRSATVPSTTVQASPATTSRPGATWPAARSCAAWRWSARTRRTAPSATPTRSAGRCATAPGSCGRSTSCCAGTRRCGCRRRSGIASKTRFKAWWDLVGAPLELAAMLACDAQAAAEAGQRRRAVPLRARGGGLRRPVRRGRGGGGRDLGHAGAGAAPARGLRGAALLGRRPGRAAAGARVRRLRRTTAGRGTKPSGGRRRRRSGRRRCGRRWRARPARRCRRGRRPRRAWSASACRWWWGGRWRSAAARSGRWPRRTPATRPTPTGWRSRRRSVAHDHARKSTARAARPRRATPGFPGIPARRRERRESRECDGGARRPRSGTFARERRPRLGPGGAAAAAAGPRRWRAARPRPPPARERPPPARSASATPAGPVRRDAPGKPRALAPRTEPPPCCARARRRRRRWPRPTRTSPGSARRPPPASGPRRRIPRGPAWWRCCPTARACTTAASAGGWPRGASAWRWTVVGTAPGSASSTRDAPDDATRPPAPPARPRPPPPPGATHEIVMVDQVASRNA